MADKYEVNAEEVDPDYIPRKETWRDFLYNPDSSTVLGRTGLSWCEYLLMEMNLFVNF